jgi:hypothetical protein
LATPLGKKKKDLSATIADDKGALCDLDPKNIINMTDGDVPDAKRQASRSIKKLEGKLSGRTSYRVFVRLAMEKWWKCKNLSFLLFNNQR